MADFFFFLTRFSEEKIENRKILKSVILII